MSIPELIKRVGAGQYKDGSSLTQGTMYHPIPFPEYQTVPVHKSQCREELRAIENCYDFRGKTVLEVGSAGGYFTFNIAKKAYYVIAFEADKSVCDVTNAIRAEKEYHNISFINKPFKLMDASRLRVDVVLMLNVHMWIHKQEGWDKTKWIMEAIANNRSTIFFQTAHAESRGMHLVKELKDLEAIMGYLRECGFKEPRHIETILHDGHPRYMVMA